MRKLLRLVLAAGFLGLMPQVASALSCRATVSNINFGSVSVRTGATNQTSGTVNISCSGTLLSLVGVCLRFGPGSGGAGNSNSPRYMRRGDGAALPYQLRPVGNGNAFGTLNEIYVPVTTLLGRGSATVPIFADITANSVAVGSGQYSSTFSGASDIEMEYGELTTCALLNQSASIPPFTVSAEVVPSCELDVTSLNFGTISGSLNQPVDETATINVRCTSDTDYTVGLDMGGGGGSNPANRQMRSGLQTLNYGLYRDGSRTMPWGNLPGNSMSATGNGSNNAFTVHGRIHAGQSPGMGVYTDSVIVTITY
ncbi:spore coat U domain-containing protein [Lentibacter algarum]|uniref:Csu type fimbrial protein n=1 Tax=Lentibacter algarum TaxID=576131 RepID=UPI001C08B36D|nr:spore coat U domain-containing protein [Lentibacter algarum]MBU2983076.1 spore coat U domain-containing protein [Lentibacter algarum]